MALLALTSGLALAMMVARMMALLALVMVLLAPALLLVVLLLPALALPALAPVGTRVQRLEQLKTRRTRQLHESSGDVRGGLPRLQGAAVAVEA